MKAPERKLREINWQCCGAIWSRNYLYSRKPLTMGRSCITILFFFPLALSSVSQRAAASARTDLAGRLFPVCGDFLGLEAQPSSRLSVPLTHTLTRTHPTADTTKEDVHLKTRHAKTADCWLSSVFRHFSQPAWLEKNKNTLFLFSCNPSSISKHHIVWVREHNICTLLSRSLG